MKSSVVAFSALLALAVPALAFPRDNFDQVSNIDNLDQVDHVEQFGQAEQIDQAEQDDDDDKVKRDQKAEQVNQAEQGDQAGQIIEVPAMRLKYTAQQKKRIEQVANRIFPNGLPTERELQAANVTPVAIQRSTNAKQCNRDVEGLVRIVQAVTAATISDKVDYKQYRRMALDKLCA